MDYSFTHYLLAKQSVDDRALNKDVLHELREHLPPEPVSIIEAGAGIGTMLKRLVDWKIFCAGEYVLVDGQEENINYAREWIPRWATETGMNVEGSERDQLRIFDQSRDIRIRMVCADVFDFIHKNQMPADMLIAHAFLDLLPMPESLERLLSLTQGLAWLTINFDGVSSLEPVIDPAFDEKVERLYHATMDARFTGGESHMGRRLFEYVRCVNAEVLSAGSSDWVVYASDGRYPADEKYFLQFILNFFETSLKGCAELDPHEFDRWLAQRHAQIERGDLVYIAHQMDLLVHKK